MPRLDVPFNGYSDNYPRTMSALWPCCAHVFILSNDRPGCFTIRGDIVLPVFLQTASPRLCPIDQFPKHTRFGSVLLPCRTISENSRRSRDGHLDAFRPDFLERGLTRRLVTGTLLSVTNDP